MEVSRCDEPPAWRKRERPNAAGRPQKVRADPQPGSRRQGWSSDVRLGRIARLFPGRMVHGRRLGSRSRRHQGEDRHGDRQSPSPSSRVGRIAQALLDPIEPLSSDDPSRGLDHVFLRRVD